MRTIEFRGKKVNSDEWLYGDLIHDNIEGCYIYPVDAENLYKENAVIPDTVGQFIGKRDANGKKIYEGDLLRVKTFFDILTGDDDKDADGYAIFQARYDEERMEFQYVLVAYTKDKPRCKTLAYWQAGYRNIIGNIYDNPELLNNLQMEE